MEFKLEVENFLTIEQASVDLAGRGLLLLQGVNKDDTSASSNGAGKSSLVDALCWSLYGTTARDVSGDAVVNRKAKKNCKVITTITDGDIEYRVVRYRKHNISKNMLTVSQRDMTTGLGGDLSKGTDKETQEVVNKILGCSLDVFLGAIYAGQEKMPDLPGMTDKNLKLLVEEAAGTEELAEAYTEARSRALKVEGDYNTAATHHKSMQQRLEEAQKEELDAATEHGTFEAERKDRARAKLAPSVPEQEALAKEKAWLAAAEPKADLEAQKAALQVKLDGRRGEEEKLRELQQVQREAAAKETRFRASVESTKQAYQQAEKNLADVNKQVGKPCGECGKTYCEADLAEARALREKSLASRKTDLQEYVAGAKAAILEHQAATQAVKDFEAGMTDVSATLVERDRLDKRRIEIEAVERNIAARERNIEAYKDAARACLTEPNPWDKVLATRRDNVARITKELALTEKAVLDLEEKLQLHKQAVEVFGPAGVRAHILDTVTPFLNEKTSEYLGALSDGNIQAGWSTLTKNAKGEMKEKFTIDVTHAEGGDSFDALSGGEKRKVRIATNLALQDLKASRAEKPIDLWIGDEIDHALDEPGLERLMTVLDRKAKERGTVVVISHNSLRDWIDQVITVTKEGRSSTISGATERGL